MWTGEVSFGIVPHGQTCQDFKLSNQGPHPVKVLDVRAAARCCRDRQPVTPGKEYR